MAGVHRHGLRVLDASDSTDVLELCGRDPVGSIFVTSRLATDGVAAGQLWGWGAPGELEALCWDGANLVPVGDDPRALDAFADRARRGGRRCSSLVGPAAAVMGLWSRLEGAWGPARDVRPDQPLMAVDGDPRVAPDPQVRRAVRDDIDVLLPACVAMFTEEVGYSPVAADGGAAYGRRVAELVDAGRSFLRVEGEGAQRRVVFKAELGAVAPGVAQVQGVWVHPEHRGEGLAEPGMAAVVVGARAAGLPLVSLYVNDYNTRAVRAYEAVGFQRVGTFATVLF